MLNSWQENRVTFSRSTTVRVSYLRNESHTFPTVLHIARFHIYSPTNIFRYFSSYLIFLFPCVILFFSFALQSASLLISTFTQSLLSHKRNICERKTFICTQRDELTRSSTSNWLMLLIRQKPRREKKCKCLMTLTSNMLSQGSHLIGAGGRPPISA